MVKVDPKVGAVVPAAGVPNVEAPNEGSCVPVCPKLDPKPPKPVAVVGTGVVPKAVPKPVAKSK